jgi:ABC-type Na+ efflux pump permease subunit
VDYIRRFSVTLDLVKIYKCYFQIDLKTKNKIMKKSLWIISILVLISTMLFACDSSTSVEVEEEVENNTVIRALVTNSSDTETSLDFTVLITNPLGQENLGSSVDLEGSTGAQKILAVSEKGATALQASVSVTVGGNVRLSIEAGEMDENGNVEFEEVLFVFGGLNQTVSITYESN